MYLKYYYLSKKMEQNNNVLQVVSPIQIYLITSDW